MRETFIPLFTSTVRSSLWSLPGDCLKVFLTLALEADPEGYVSGSVDGLRRLVDLPIEDVKRHLLTLASPDPHSKDISRKPDTDGKRIEVVPNGWRVLNLEWYRELARKESEKARKRKWWASSGTGARRDARRTETETQNDLPSVDVAPQRKRRGNLSHFVPDDWSPKEKHLLFAEENSLRFEAEVRKFRNHEFKVARSDWDKAFSNWLDKSSDDGTKRVQRRPAHLEEDKGFA